MTIDDLASMMQKEFSAIHDRFDRVESDVAELKQDVSELKGTTSRIERVQQEEINRADTNEQRLRAVEAARA